ncbi:hypothetical protein ES705_24306 [subsurface metagenome]
MKETKDFYKYELIKAADVLVRDMIKLKKDETVVVTLDTESDYRVADAIAGVAHSVGGKPMVISVPAPLGSAKAADKYLPLEPFTAAITKTNVWVELNNRFLLYSTPYVCAVKENPNLRYVCFGGLNVDMMVRCVGRIKLEAQKAFQEKVAERTRNSKTMRITTVAGGDVTFKNNPKWPITCEYGGADIPGSHMMPGQVGWAPFFESINGTIVFDGSVSPLGLINVPIKLHVEKGNIIKIEGGEMAIEYEKHLKSFNDPQMFRMAHVCYGFNLGAKLSGNMLEDERVWGAINWGIGDVGPTLVPEGIPAASHSDGICLNSSVWLDGVQIMDKGQLLDPELKKLAEKLRKVEIKKEGG